MCLKIGLEDSKHILFTQRIVFTSLDANIYREYRSDYAINLIIYMFVFSKARGWKRETETLHVGCGQAVLSPS
jgi:hypothetical protein